MQTSATSKFFARKIAGLVLFSFLFLSWKPISNGITDFLGELHLKLDLYKTSYPSTKIYLVSDKPLYEPGDVIWFSLFARNGYTHTDQQGSLVVHLINPQGTVEASQYLYNNSNGNNYKGNFNLKPDQPGGLYKLRAFNSNNASNENNLVFEKTIQVQDVVMPRLKLTLDFERKAYGPGSPVSARIKAFSNDNKPLSGQAFQVVVSLDGKKVKETKSSINKNGTGTVKFQLPDSLKSTDGQLNLIFTYDGLSESVSKSIPILLNKVQLSFFPEGGELVNGLESKLAFRALDEFNKPADVAGDVLDQSGKVVASFSSFHDGMGEFNFKPELGKTYQARLTSPAGVKTRYALPLPMETGYVMQVSPAGKEQLNVNIRSAIEAKVALIGQMRGHIYYERLINLKPGDNPLEIAVSDFPIGVLQLTLFDQRTIERAERLVFVNNHKQLNIKVKTDKEKYLPREKVRLTVSATDETGMPIPADVMVSVVDDQLLTYMNDKSSNILSWMLVESEIKGKVEEPRFYFDKEEPNAPMALDLLLKTAGWRRFTWQAVRQMQVPFYQYSGDKLLAPNRYEVSYMETGNYYKEISGHIMATNNTPLSPDAKIKLIRFGKLIQTIKPDQHGSFRFGNLPPGKYDLEIETAGQKEALITGIEIQEKASPFLNIHLPTPIKPSLAGLASRGNPLDKKEKTKIKYAASKDGKGKISGRLVDENTKEPIAFATVVIKYKGVQKNYGQTDIDGNFTISPIVPGTYNLEVPYVGYHTRVIKGLQVKEQKETRLAFELSPDTRSLAEVEVVVYKEPLISRDRMGATITQQEIAKLPTRDVSTMAYTTAGVQSSDDGRGVAVRGTRNTGTIYYVNGVKQLTAPQLPSTSRPAVNRVSSSQPQITRAISEERQKFREAIYTEKKPVEHHNYTRIREFASPVYTSSETPAERTDFRKTLFWQPLVKLNRNGVAELEFYTGDDITSYNVLVEGISFDGSPGRHEHKFYSQLPFNVLAKLPEATLENDRISVPLILKNNTAKDVKGKLEITHPAGWKFLGKEARDQVVKANSTNTVYLDYQVSGTTGSFDFGASFEAQGLKDAFKQPVIVEQRGYPINKSIAGNSKEQEFLVDASNMTPGTAQVSFSAYPSIMADLLKGVEGMLREPYGCFEQTSSSSYPNLMVLEYLRDQERPDKALIARAEEYMNKAYNRLINFETKEKGYDWFSTAPAHEGLTAFALLQFSDMQRLGGKVDPDMIERTKAWMLSRRDGKGGFTLSTRHGGGYGHTEPTIANAYIVYSLTEAGFKNLQLELDHAAQAAESSNDPYRMALVTNALFTSGNKPRAESLMAKLLKSQNPTGSWTGNKFSVTNSTGRSLEQETTALVVMAMLKSGHPSGAHLQAAIKFLAQSRNGYGSFGSTQATVLTLKALTAYTRYSRKTNESGTIQFYVEKKKAGEQSYLANQSGEIQILNLDKYFDKPDNYKVKVQFEKTNEPLPYSMGLNYFSNTPPNSPECKVKLETTLNTEETTVGSTVRYSAKIRNLQPNGLPMTMAIIGIPAGLSVNPAQLKELQEKKVFDFYEISGNRLVCYLRDMAPKEEVIVNLDLKAEFPGTYESPAGSAYLYYTNEHKNWTAGTRITIKQ